MKRMLCFSKLRSGRYSSFLRYVVFAVFQLTVCPSAFSQKGLVIVNGYAQGTTYQVKYLDEESRNFRKSIDSLLKDFDSALSLYDENSELSLFNRSHAVRFSLPYFHPVLVKSKEIYEATGGLFDPTVMPLVEAYGFGPGGKRSQAALFDLDSVRRLVGFNKIVFDDQAVRKSEEHVKLDFNAIAQGYSVDVICDFLIQNGIRNYLVEVGGELRGGGLKADGTPWVVGISNPLRPEEFLGTVKINDRALATSGNYRNQYVRDGVRYTHIVNPISGMPGVSDILSITVLAPDAMTADGFATAFLLMGIDHLKRVIKDFPHLDVLVAYSNADGTMSTFVSDGLKGTFTAK